LLGRHGDRGPEVTSDRDPDPEDQAPPGHVLGPLEFDRDDLVYFATCSCGHRFGPLAAVATLQVELEHHRGTLKPPTGPPDPPSP
jgi:hypothetical protein